MILTLQPIYANWSRNSYDVWVFATKLPKATKGELYGLTYGSKSGRYTIDLRGNMSTWARKTQQWDFSYGTFGFPLQEPVISLLARKW